jgi:REP element-mobilizing transposase RayT
VPVRDDTYATRRHLPHLAKRDRTYFVTFATRDRFVLPPAARQIVLDCCVHDHDVTYWLHTAIVMPDHVHMLFVPIEEWSLDRIMRRVKGVSARLINQELQRRGPLWQDESFDRILRSDEDVSRKGEYIANNPVRKGLVATPAEYPWLWRTGNPACPR